MVISVVPPFVNVSGLDGLTVLISWVANVTDEGASETNDPEPDRATFCGLLAALSVITRDAFRDPSAVGANVSEMVQETPDASEDPQVLLPRWKSPLFAPVTVTLEMLRVVFSLLVNVVVSGELVDPRPTPPKFNARGHTWSPGENLKSMALNVPGIAVWKLPGVTGKFVE